MDPVQKALWFVETHSRDAITLDAIAQACGVSAYHLTRAFAAATGLSLMRYVRARRLSDAARQLTNRPSDIFSVALDAGYGSHEAFTRAFRDHFGFTPEQIRAQGHVNQLHLVEAIAMKATPVPDLLPPRFEIVRPMLLAGIVETYDCQAPTGIADQWQRFMTYAPIPPGEPVAAYGVSYNFTSDGNFDYLCGIEVPETVDLPEAFRTLRLKPEKYVVFSHPGHVAGIRGTFTAIWSAWFPESGCEPIEAPTLERYGPGFNPMTGLGDIEIWIAIKS